MTKRFLSSPIIAVAVAFMAGILAGNYLHLPGVGVLFVAFLSLIGIVVTLRLGTKIIPVFLVLLLWASLGLLSYQIRYQRSRPDDISRSTDSGPPTRPSARRCTLG